MEKQKIKLTDAEKRIIENPLNCISTVLMAELFRLSKTPVKDFIVKMSEFDSFESFMAYACDEPFFDMFPQLNFFEDSDEIKENSKLKSSEDDQA